ncbi:type III-B CRISPR module RAMP protein Cmr1 [Maridesulfovibrio bastinii]|uniref:type III-B CRISPR module RAMP protein Cmr1 n=1 Tax=Maridesulfovibrio bastinii TaxID=47157 RepID=UPI0004198190|nr:type III-B CRISPR module RAMP protein Cmr1 [Maridesulfovibrio bastinii]
MRDSFLQKLPGFNSKCSKIITKDFKFELITPMFGGDAESWKLNLNAPVRAQSIKGQLRFWWRTMQNETDSSKLLELENALWGGTTEKKGKEVRLKSKVQIAIFFYKKRYEGKKAIDCIPKYVAFPAERSNTDALCITDLNFKLRISYPNSAGIEKDVLKTLKLWTLFGGVGARTRRGCGSLYCEELLKGFKEAQDINNFIKEIGGDPAPIEYSRLACSLLAVNISSNSTTSAWEEIINNYKDFRQDRRLKNGNKFGRSYWPEPDAIRILTKRNSPLHAPAHPDKVWFPRAAFGLPIITKFNQDGNGKGDPDVVELHPKNAPRWPSLVIIKVIKLSSCILKVVLVLNQAFPDGLKLEYSNDNDRKKWPKIKAIPSTAHPDNYVNKVMRTNHPLNGDFVYKALFDELGVNEI